MTESESLLGTWIEPWTGLERLHLHRSEDALARLTDDLGVSDEHLPRLPQLDGDTVNALKSRYMLK